MGVAFFALVVGAFHALAPRAAWYMSIGWKLKDGEPSDLYIGMSRFFGGAAAIIALIVIIVRMITGISSAHQQTAWVSQFNSNLTVNNVAAITDDFNHPTSTDEENTVLSLLKQENLSSITNTNTGGGFTWNGEFKVQFKSGETITLTNQSGSLWDLTSSDPNASEYEFEDANLVDWYQNWQTRVNG